MTRLGLSRFTFDSKLSAHASSWQPEEVDTAPLAPSNSNTSSSSSAAERSPRTLAIYGLAAPSRSRYNNIINTLDMDSFALLPGVGGNIRPGMRIQASAPAREFQRLCRDAGQCSWAHCPFFHLESPPIDSFEVFAGTTEHHADTALEADWAVPADESKAGRKLSAHASSWQPGVNTVPRAPTVGPDHVNDEEDTEESWDDNDIDDDDNDDDDDSEESGPKPKKKRQRRRRRQGRRRNRRRARKAIPEGTPLIRVIDEPKPAFGLGELSQQLSSVSVSVSVSVSADRTTTTIPVGFARPRMTQGSLPQADRKPHKLNVSPVKVQKQVFAAPLLYPTSTVRYIGPSALNSNRFSSMRPSCVSRPMSSVMSQPFHSARMVASY